MATKPKSDAKPASPDLRGKIVDALMELAAERRFEDISVRDICKTAGVSMADFRDFFPSKGAALAGFSRRIDRAVLTCETNLDGPQLLKIPRHGGLGSEDAFGSQQVYELLLARDNLVEYEPSDDVMSPRPGHSCRCSVDAHRLPLIRN